MLDDYFHPLAKALSLAAAGAVGLMIDEQTGMSVGVMAVLIGAVFYTGRKFQGILDEFEEIRRELRAMRETLHSRPCVKVKECPLPIDDLIED